MVVQGNSGVPAGAWARRLWRHLTRKRARAGWTLAVVAIALYGIYPDEWAFADPVQQFLLVLASVAAGAIFLPELSSDLWTMRPEQVRALIPHDRVRALQASLIRAQLAETEVQWADEIVASAIDPLLEVSRMQPDLIVRDLIYLATIQPVETIQVGTVQRDIRRVEASIRGRRLLPGAGRVKAYWFSFARDRTGLVSEFNEAACLFREVVELDESWSDEQWRTAILEMTRVRIVFDGTSVTASSQVPDGVVETANGRLVRWYVDATELGAIAASTRRHPITLSIDYLVDATTDSLLLVFPKYYISGGMQATVRLYDQSDAFDLRHEVFLGRAPTTAVDTGFVDKVGLCKQLTVVASDSAIIWPGSGLIVWWAKR